MTEKEIKDKFIRNHFDNFKKLIKSDKLRLYGIEFPVRTQDGVKFADVVCEINDEDYSLDNKLLILEFKKLKVDSLKSAISQTLLYSTNISKQLYRRKKASAFIIAPEFSNFEIEMSYKNNVIPVQYDYKSGAMRIVKFSR